MSSEKVISAAAARRAILKAAPHLAYIIDNLPWEEIKHGRWEKFGYDFRCSACGVYQCGHYVGMTNYCPNCGADMRGEEDG